MAKRERLFFAIAVSLPFLLLGAVELGLRLFWDGGRLPLFETAPVGNGTLLVANPSVAARWFVVERQPPAPNPELFAAVKPANGFRVFVLGESAAQGFPYPRTGSFPRLLRSVLRDALPNDSVEVINLGIAATNSFAMLDLVNEVVDQKPDLVLVYAGHNEYYGVLGAASSERFAAPSAAVTRTFLRLQRLRLVMLARRYVARLRAPKLSESATASASFMESVARDRNIVLGGEAFQRGVEQYEENLDILLSTLRDAGVPVVLASIPGNVRDQSPFVADSNEAARAAFARARIAFDNGDSAAARDAFSNARDLDVIRFRAPSVFRDIAERVAARNGATYAPVTERFASQAPAGAPGAELFLEHVHPNADGYSLVARTFWEALRVMPAFVSRLDTSRLKPWTQYEAERYLTSFDERLVAHRVATITTRWPFVPVEGQRDYRREYVPVSVVDSIAFAVAAGGAAWETGKLQLAEQYLRAGEVDAAVNEYRGLIAELDGFELPARLAGTALVRAGRYAEGDSLLARAMASQQTSSGAAEQGFSFAQQERWAEAIDRYRLAVQLDARNVEAMYRLSLAYALSGDAVRARATATELARRAPGYPPLAEWLKTLGITP